MQKVTLFDELGDALGVVEEGGSVEGEGLVVRSHARLKISHLLVKKMIELGRGGKGARCQITEAVLSAFFSLSDGEINKHARSNEEEANRD